MTRRELQDYRKKIRRAMDDAFLSQALDRFVTSYRESREKAMQGLDFAACRAAIVRHREAALDDWDRLATEFTRQAQERGAQVHWAADAQRACDIIHGIAADNCVSRAVKSKSMTTEEICLNDALERTGIQVTETDLGEWIIQLRRERPSHMVLPAIHLSRRDVADLFAGHLNRKFDADDIETLVRTARSVLRNRFLNAELGITGANFALANSGTIGLVTNEGNARLVTSLPPIHVAVVGIDKIVADAAAALDILRLLPRSATGQTLSTYVTWISGATHCTVGRNHQRQTHIVLLDNGRSEMARSPFREALRCIRCGACANVCPVFRVIGGHLFGHIYVGPIGLILTYFFHGFDKAKTIAKNCINCLACKGVCPANIDLPHLINDISTECLNRQKPPLRNAIVGYMTSHRVTFHRFLGSLSVLQRPLRKKSGLMALPRVVPPVHRFRHWPTLARRSFRENFDPQRPSSGSEAQHAVLFGGCLMDFVYPEQGHALVDLLNRAGTSVTYPLGQTCCGLPAHLSGRRDDARKAAAANLDALCGEAFDICVVLCASCGSFLKNHMPQLLADDPQRAQRASWLADRVVDSSSLLVELMSSPSLACRHTGTRVAVHAPCHLCRGLGVTEAPRRLIQNAGYTYVKTPDEDVCCGFGGSYSIDFPEISAQLVNRKLDQVETCGAPILVTDCPGCVLQLRGANAQRGGTLEVIHTAELLARNLM